MKKILVICYMGRNRSRYLAEFLQEKNYEADYAGILPEGKNLVTQAQVDKCDTVVFVLPRIKEKFLVKFTLTEQKVITLNVEDRLDILCPEKINPTTEQAISVYEQYVYPELEKQFSKYL